MQVEFKIPDIGTTDAVTVADILVKVGDKVTLEQDLLMLETDKATMEVPSDTEGTIVDIKVKVGDKVHYGDIVIVLESSVAAQPLITEPGPVVNDTNSTQLTKQTVPDLGGNDNVSVIEVLVKAGDIVEKEQTLITLETDKATMEVPSSFAGVVELVITKVGDKVNLGDIILEIRTTEAIQSKLVEIIDSKPVAIVAEVIKSPSVVVNNTQVATSNVNEDSFKTAFASPSIRKLARELGADLGKVSGTGAKNRITESDLKLHIKNILQNSRSTSAGNGSGLNLLPWPEIDFSQFGEITVTDLSRIKKISGANLARNWAMIPHVTQFDEADITSLEEFRKSINEEYKKSDIKVTPLAFMIKACVFALQQFPEINSSIVKDTLVLKNFYNIGLAADTPNGLVVPVLKNADKKGIIQIAQETSELALAARNGKLKPADMQGGTFTISSLGGIGGTAFTPIINAPEVAILGISKSSMKPVWNGNEFEPKLMLPLSFSYDHRIIDGAMAAKFTTYLSKVLSDIRRLAL